MRCPAFHLLLVAFLAVALAAGGVAASDAGGSPLTAPDATTALSTPSIDESSIDEPSIDGDTSAGTIERAAVSADDTAPPALSGGEPASVQFNPATETEMRVELDPDRDAEWTVIVRYELTDANETAAFETVAERYLDGEVGPSESLFENFAAGASENTDRQMAIEDVDRSVAVLDEEDGDLDDMDVPEDVVAVGELRLTFTWTAFLEEDGDDLVLGDALTTPTNGTWLRSLEDGQTIEVTPPSGYSVSVTSLPIRDSAVIIEGPVTFDADERVEVVYSQTGVAAAGDLPWTLIVGGIVVAALLIAGGLLGYRRSDVGDGGAPAEDVTRPGDAPGPGMAEPTGSTDAGASVGEGSNGVGADADPAPEEDLSLLSDDERVERLLDRNGGRMRQAAIVRETGWSDAKVSQLLSRMAEAGQVEKLRLGRENLISLPDGEEGATRGTDGNGETGTSGENGETGTSGENGETGTDNGESESPSETGSGTV